MADCAKIQTSADVVFQSAIESTFKTAQTVSDRYKAIGANVTIDSLNGNKNYIRVNEIGSRVSREIVPAGFSGDWSGTAMFSNPFFVAITYDWSLAKIVDLGDGLTWYKLPINDRVPKSLTLKEGYNLSLEGVETNYHYDLRTIVGAVLSSYTMSANAGEEVSISMDGIYASESVSRVDSGSSTFATAYATYKALNTTDDRVPFIFYNASLTFDSEAISPVSTFSVTLPQNPEFIYGMGAQTPECVYGKIIEPSGNFTVPVNNMDLIKKYMDNSTSATTIGSSEASLALMLTFAKEGDTNKIKLEYTKLGLNYNTDIRIGEVKNHELTFEGANSYAYITGADFVEFMEDITGISAPTP